MEYKKLLLLSSLITILTGCSAENLDAINPSANNSWGMRLTVDGLDEEYYDSSEGNEDNEDDTSKDDESTISRGDSNEAINADSDMESEVISSTLTDDILESLNKIDADVENAPDIDIVDNSKVHAAAYIDKYLNPKVTEILNTIKSNNTVKDYSTLYFKVLYRGLDMDESGNPKWVTYTKSYQNLKDSDYFISDQAVILSQLSNWGSIGNSLRTAYEASESAAIDFGNCAIKDGNNEVFVKDCSREDLLRLLNTKENSGIRNRYINYYLEAISTRGGTPKYSGYSSYLNSFKNSIELSYSSAAYTAAHIAGTVPAFSSSNCEWISYAARENAFDSNTTLTRRRISVKDLSSAFATSKSKNSGMGNSSIKYSAYDKYGGNVYYFENGNHKLAVFFYGDNLWKAENSEVEEVIRTSLEGFKGPQDFNASDFQNNT